MKYDIKTLANYLDVPAYDSFRYLLLGSHDEGTHVPEDGGRRRYRKVEFYLHENGHCSVRIDNRSGTETGGGCLAVTAGDRVRMYAGDLDAACTFSEDYVGTLSDTDMDHAWAVARSDACRTMNRIHEETAPVIDAGSEDLEAGYGANPYTLVKRGPDGAVSNHVFHSEQELRSHINAMDEYTSGYHIVSIFRL